MNEIDQFENAGQCFVHALRKNGRIGWTYYGPVSKSGDSLLRVYFHTHPEDSDLIFDLITRCIDNSNYWFFERTKGNRFKICPRELVEYLNVESAMNHSIFETQLEKPSLGKIFSTALFNLAGKLMSRAK